MYDEEYNYHGISEDKTLVINGIEHTIDEDCFNDAFNDYLIKYLDINKYIEDDDLIQVDDETIEYENAVDIAEMRADFLNEFAKNEDIPDNIDPLEYIWFNMKNDDTEEEFFEF